MTRATHARRWLSVAAAIALLIAVTLIVWGLTHPVVEERMVSPPALPTPGSSGSGDAPAVPNRQSTAPVPAPLQHPGPPGCRNQSSDLFEVTKVQLVGVGSYPAEAMPLDRTVVNGETVVTLPVPADDNPGIFAWDESLGPAGDDDMVRLTAHTWSDDSALGNVILDNVRRGSVIIVRGEGAGQLLCFLVTDTVATTFHKPTAAEKARANKVLGRYNGSRNEGLGLMVCKDYLSPGLYRERYNVFAERIVK